MWILTTTAEYEKRRDKWPPKHRREFRAMHDNLDTLFGTLKEGVNPEQAKRQLSFVHAKYPKGILSIDQKGGGGGGLKQSRLYVYPDADEKRLYLLTMGDKSQQSSDVKFCEEWADDHISQKNAESQRDE